MLLLKENPILFVLYRSDMNKDQMVVDAAFRTKVLLWSGIVLGTLSIGILGYAAVRYYKCHTLSIVLFLFEVA